MEKRATPLYRRVLLKLSGEALQGQLTAGIDAGVLARIVDEIVSLCRADIQVAIVIGAGNFCRGRDWVGQGFDPLTCDRMGMLATVMNALPLQDAFLQRKVPAQVLSAFAIAGIVQGTESKLANDYLNQGQVVIFAGGTGNPLVTTDTAASLRSIEIGAEVLIKATNVDGVYDTDPKQYPHAKLYKQLTYQQALTDELAIMDLTAFCQCRQYGMPIRVFNMMKPGALVNLVYSEHEGTLIKGEK